MTDPTDQILTPYDTGERCEPKLWGIPTRHFLQCSSEQSREAEFERFGMVDFEDDGGDTVAAVHVARGKDGSYTLHVTSFVGAGELSVVLDEDPVV